MSKSLKPEDYEFSSMAYFESDLTRNQKLAVLNCFSAIAASVANKKK